MFAEQGGMLTQVVDKNGDGVFVASVMLMQNTGTGAMNSVCAWTNGVRAMLPQTEQIAFMRDPEANVVGNSFLGLRHANMPGR